MTECVDQALPLTLLLGSPNTWELSVSDTRGIIRAVVTLTDLGRRPGDWPVGVTTEQVVDLLLGCLALARARQDTDLAEELGTCLACLEAPATPSTPAPVRVPADVLAAASHWLSEHGAGDLRTLAWSARARIAAGCPASARVLLADAAISPGYGALVGHATRDIAVTVATLAARLGVHDETLEAVLADAPAPAAPPVGLRPLATDLSDRDRGRLLAADLVSRGSQPTLSGADQEVAGNELVAGALTAAETYDLAWFAVAVRGMVRLPHLPRRLVRDAVTFLATQQHRSGAMGAPITEDPRERRDQHREWTLMATAALVEAAGA